jgi:hypothetical protein
MITTNDPDDLEIGDDLSFTCQTERSIGGTWVIGLVAGHRFQALVFPAAAENTEYELGDSRISKLWVQRISDSRVVFNWDRGLDVPAVDAAAQTVVDFLAAGLADHVYAE